MGFDFSLPPSYRSQNLRNVELENDKIVPKAAVPGPDADELIAPGTPIQFDIVLPATEFLDQNRGSRYGLREAVPGRNEGTLGYTLCRHPSAKTVAVLTSSWRVSVLLAEKVLMVGLWPFIPLGASTPLVRPRTRHFQKQKVSGWFGALALSPQNDESLK